MEDQTSSLEEASPAVDAVDMRKPLHTLVEEL